MKRGGPLARGKALARRTRLKPVSDKRQEDAPRRKTVREEVFERDDYTCRVAPFFPDEPCYGELTVHHVKKASALGGYTPDNLVSACARHNDLIEERPAEAEALGLVKRWRPPTDS